MSGKLQNNEFQEEYCKKLVNYAQAVLETPIDNQGLNQFKITYKVEKGEEIAKGYYKLKFVDLHNNEEVKINLFDHDDTYFSISRNNIDYLSYKDNKIINSCSYYATYKYDIKLETDCKDLKYQNDQISNQKIKIKIKDIVDENNLTVDKKAFSAQETYTLNSENLLVMVTPFRVGQSTLEVSEIAVYDSNNQKIGKLNNIFYSFDKDNNIIHHNLDQDFCSNKVIHYISKDCHYFTLAFEEKKTYKGVTGFFSHDLPLPKSVDNQDWNHSIPYIIKLEDFMDKVKDELASLIIEKLLNENKEDFLKLMKGPVINKLATKCISPTGTKSSKKEVNALLKEDSDCTEELMKQDRKKHLVKPLAKKNISNEKIVDILLDDNNLANQIANKIKINPIDFLNKIDGYSLTWMLFDQSKIDKDKAKEIVKDKVDINKLTSDLFNRSEIDKNQAKNITENKVSTYKLANFLFDKSEINKKQAIDIVQEKVSPLKLTESLFTASELNNQNKAITTIEKIANTFLVQKKEELGKAIIKADTNGSIPEKVAENLRKDENFQHIVSQGLKAHETDINKSLRVRRSTEKIKDEAINEITKLKSQMENIKEETTSIKNETINTKNNAQHFAENAQIHTRYADKKAKFVQHQIEKFKNIIGADIQSNNELIEDMFDTISHIRSNITREKNRAIIHKMIDEKENSDWKNDIGKVMNKVNKKMIQMKSNIEDFSMNSDHEIDKKVNFINKDIEQLQENIHQAEHEFHKIHKRSAKKLEDIKTRNQKVDINFDESKRKILKIVKGENYGDISEAKIELEDVNVATFPKFGYFLRDTILHIRNHMTNKDICIPGEFLFLRVIKDDHGDYKFTFSNEIGNLFFDYKKYDHMYGNLPIEYKLIDLNNIKMEKKINLNEYYSDQRLFILRKGDLEKGSFGDFSVEIYELSTNKKIGILVDECGIYKQNKFYYIDYHRGFDSPSSEELNIKIENNGLNTQIKELDSNILIENVHLIGNTNFSSFEYVDYWL